METHQESVAQDLHALGHAGSDTYVGLELIPLKQQIVQVTFSSDEFTAICPVTGQPDLYDIEITLHDPPVTIESKSLKLYLRKFRNEGAFCEVLCSQIAQHIYKTIHERQMDQPGPIFHEDQVEVTIWQKARGGIEIEVTA